MGTATGKATPGSALKEELLHEAVRELLAGRPDAAAARVVDLVGTLDLDARPSDLTYHVFASALAKRLRLNVPGINLYLRRFDLSHISLSDVLAAQLPLVSIPTAVTNDVLAAVIGGEPAVTLLDIGVGTGQHEVALVAQLHRLGRLPRRFHVVAVEPSPSSLAEAERLLGVAAQVAGIRVSFTAVDASPEDLTDDVWRQIQAAVGDDTLVVHAAFALHHIAGKDVEGPLRAREAFFGRLRSLEPKALVLAEPNSDHYEPDYARRFANCWRHYGAVFHLIDSLRVDERNRATMKLFFAREIDDILANDEGARYELHEPTQRWLARLESHGFVPAEGLEALAGPAGDGVELVARRGQIGLEFDGELLVSVICAGSEPLTLPLAPAARRRPSDTAGPSRWTPTTAERLRVRDVMTRDVAIVSIDATLAEAADVIWRTQASDLAVLDAEGRFVGVLSEGDLIRRLLPASEQTARADGSQMEAFDLLILNGHHAAPQSIEPLVIRDPIVLAPGDDLVLVASEMIGRQIRRFPVVDRDRRLVGTISRADLCRALMPASARSSAERATALRTDDRRRS